MSELLAKFKLFLDSDRLRSAVVNTTDETLTFALNTALYSIVERLGSADYDTPQKIIDAAHPLIDQCIMILATFWLENNSFYTNSRVNLDDSFSTEKRFWGNVFPAVQAQADHLIQLSGLRQTECFVL